MPGDDPVSLYRRFRPQRFGDLRGQDFIAKALANSVAQDRVSHAYLFSGPRGTGKTSTARILAKALNCEEVRDGEPCGQCGSCQAVTDQSSLDVQELDAASNNGVDAMRDLISRAGLAHGGRTKVYIVDEVHMLSMAAANALLKTLESPPPAVVFVLATTDPQKVPDTIISRTQHFRFQLLSDEAIAELLVEVLDRAGLTAPAGGIEESVRAARGSARDALSHLDQVLAAGHTTVESVDVETLVTAILDRDARSALGRLDRVLGGGSSPEMVARELIARLRGYFRLLVDPQYKTHHQETDPNPPTDHRRSGMGLAGVVKAMTELGLAQTRGRETGDPRLALELALVRICQPDADLDGLARRVEALEARLRGLMSATGPGPGTGSRPETGSVASLPKVAPLPKEVSQVAAGASDSPGPRSGRDPAPVGVLTWRDRLSQLWGDLVYPALSRRIQARLASGHFVDAPEGIARMQLSDPMTCQRAEECAVEVAEALARHLGTSVRLEFVSPGRDAAVPEVGSTARRSSASDVSSPEALADRGDRPAAAPGDTLAPPAAAPARSAGRARPGATDARMKPTSTDGEAQPPTPVTDGDPILAGAELDSAIQQLFPAAYRLPPPRSEDA
jgi:DNA polymerase-3 subunit gamma/tau